MHILSNFVGLLCSLLLYFVEYSSEIKKCKNIYASFLSISLPVCILGLVGLAIMSYVHNI